MTDPVSPPLAPAPPSAPSAEVQTEWYGWQPLIADALSIGAMLGGSTLALVDPNKQSVGYDVVGLGLAGYLVAPPAIHFAHDHLNKVGLSLALRLLVPVATFGIGGAIGVATFHSSSGPEEGSNDGPAFAIGGAVGLLSGTIVAAFIDDTLVAREALSPTSPQGATFAPAVTPVAGGATAGVFGTF